jgi:hypothetical protein
MRNWPAWMNLQWIPSLRHESSQQMSSQKHSRRMKDWGAIARNVNIGTPLVSYQDEVLIQTMIIENPWTSRIH